MSVKEFNMTEDGFDVKKSQTVRIRKIWIYLLILLFIGIPVVVGILVWQFVPPASASLTSTDHYTDTTQTPDTKTTTQITASTFDPNIGKAWDYYRLPRDVIPSHYNLTLYPNFYEDNASFHGSEVIEVEVVRPTQLLLIHSRNLNITDVAITDIDNGQSVDIVRKFPYAKYDYLVLEFASTFDSGARLKIEFEFKGSLADKLNGFYKSTYTTSTGERRGKEHLKINSNSAVAEQTESTGHVITASSASVINIETNLFKWKVKEAIEIYKHQPTMNRYERYRIPAVYQSTLSRNSTRTDQSNVASDRQLVLKKSPRWSRKLHSNNFYIPERHIVSTDMCPAFAREVFPCFDEPDMKATFTVSLIHRRDYKALSNMPVEVSGSSAEYQDMVATRFQTSVKMSTYLTCFIVCDFDHIENHTTNGHLVRVWGPSESIPQLEYSLDIALHVLDYLEDYLGIPNPVPKQDLIAIPNFDAGAMENWGIMTFRDKNLMLDPHEATIRNKQRVAAVVSHEFVHNWFGNLVTLSWWGHLWLNEGFASYLEYFGIEDKHKDWKMMSQFLVEDSQWAMIRDAMESSRPTVVHLEKRTEFYSVFDTVSYSRGASILRMMHNFMGADNFKHALQIYLKANEWGNVYTDDLWESFRQIEGFATIKTIMDTWTLQMGYPYVDVKFVVDDLGNTTVLATQQRFKLQEVEGRKSPFNYTWYIPLHYITSEDSTNQTIVWMNRTGVEFEVSLNMNNALRWIKFNHDQMGFYRVNYPDDIWRRFSNILQNNIEALGEMDRANLIDDAFSLAQAGIINYTTALDVTTYMHLERSFLSWYTFTERTSYIRDQFMNRPSDYQLLTKYVISKGKPAAESVGWEPQKTHSNTLLQTEMTYLMCMMGESTCLTNAADRFKEWINHGVRVDPELHTRVYSFGMQQAGTEENWNDVMRLYINETVPQEKLRLLYSLARTSDLTLIHRLMNLALDESVIRSQDVFTVFYYISYNPVGQDIEWLWLRANWQKLIDRFTLEDRSLGYVINTVASNFNTETQLKEVEDFFRQYPDAGASVSSREQTLESIRGNIKWQKAHYDTIVAWLRDNIQQ